MIPDRSLADKSASPSATSDGGASASPTYSESGSSDTSLPSVALRPEDEGLLEPSPRVRKSSPDGESHSLHLPQKIGGAEGM